PRLGRLNDPSPVLSRRQAGPCDTSLPPLIERTTQMSSITEPMHGNNSLTSTPLRPHRLHFHGEASRLPVGANSNFGFGMGSGWPFRFVNSGFGSNESTCERPP